MKFPRSLITYFMILFPASITLGFTQQKTSTSIPTEKTLLLENERNTISIFKNSSDLVVSVQNVQMMGNFFSRDFTEVPAGAGTGFLWDNQGHIITNYHVISGASKLAVTTKDGQTLSAEVVGVEPRKDIAILKVKKLSGKKGFSHIVSDSKKLVVGQKVLAIGSPFGFEQSLTTGIISALNRSMPSMMRSVTIRNMIQTDASINPGNSGGPLLNSLGHLVGMNASIVSPSGSSSGIGFAVPANTIHRIATQIIKHGKVIQPGLGFMPLRESYAWELKRRGYKINGLMIGDVLPQSSAKKAGLQGLRMKRGKPVLGDIITSVDGRKIKDFDDIYNVLSEKRVGEKVDIDFIRNGKKFSKLIPLQQIETF